MPSTSDNRPHIHNHIIFNSTTLDGEKKFRDSWFIALGLQKLSDIICLEHGLSVIIPKKPSERDKNRGYHRLSIRELEYCIKTQPGFCARFTKHIFLLQSDFYGDTCYNDSWYNRKCKLKNILSAMTRRLKSNNNGW